MNETIAHLEQALSQALTELDKACAASQLAWQLRLVDCVRAITLSDETAEVLRRLLAQSSTFSQADQFNAQTALATCLRTKAWCVYHLAYDQLGDLQTALSFQIDALLLFRNIAYPAGEISTLLTIGSLFERLSDYEQAASYFQEATLLARRIGDRNSEANALYHQGNLILSSNQATPSDYQSSISLLKEALTIAETIDARELICKSHKALSDIYKYSPKGTKIETKIHHQSSDKPQKNIIFSMRDEGQGLTSNDMKKLFGKFERLSATPTDGEASTGLGLSIVKQLAELHGGKVWAESDGKNQGATFFVELPAYQAA